MSNIQEKYCPGCKETHSLENFHKSKSRPDGLTSWCKTCVKNNGAKWRKNNKERKNEYAKEYYQENKDRMNVRRIERLYGLSPEEHQRMKDEQGNLCKLCNQPETGTNAMNGKIQELCIDHCHDTGKVRGLLCRRCNHLIAALGDTEQSIERVFHYMKGEL